MIKVLIKKLDQKAKIPEYKTSGSSGMDLIALLEKQISILPNQSCMIPTGWIPRLAKSAAAARPTGPAPTITTSSY